MNYKLQNVAYSKARSLLRVRWGLYLLVSLIIALANIGSVSAQSFGQSNLDYDGATSVNQGTSLMFGPDGRLYVLGVLGHIYIYTIERQGLNDYIVTDTEVLLDVKNIPNHLDDGTPRSGNTRQATGITVTGTASNPIIYATSSDNVKGGPSGDENLDTNSGVITRLTWTGSSWDVVDIVRGLPRSEENHATNGLEFVTVGNTDYLIVCSGGFTNAGSPSDNFAWITEYALAAAILSVDLTQLEAMDIKTDNGRQYIYDLPTLDDPTRDNVFPDGSPASEDPDDANYSPIDEGDPWGGNDGLNQAMLIEGSPVQMFSAGYRNTYDLVLTESGAVYATDNGANGGWGGLPKGEGSDASIVTNDYNILVEADGDIVELGSSNQFGGEEVNNKDHLTLITQDIQGYTFGSFYGGHPTPVRANPAGAGLFTNPEKNNYDPNIAVFRTLTYDPDGSAPGSTTDASIALPANWPPVSLSLANPDEADWRGPGLNNPDGPNDVLVTEWGTNTNGIDEYTASNFGGAMKGDLIAGKNNGQLRRVELDDNGLLEQLTETFASNMGGNSLGVTCNSDTDPFPGTIWVATYNSNVVVLEPLDFVECILPGEAGYSATGDNDSDGYTNQDEIDNKTDNQTDEDVICNGGAQPNDFDKAAGGNLVSDLNDPDDDNDGILDANDPFQLGNPTDNGSDGFDLPVDNSLFSDNPDLGGYLGLGFTGLMNNGAANPNWLNWLDRRDDDNDPNPNDILGGAVGAMTMQMTSGTAMGNANSQEKGFQYGVNVDQSTGGFTVSGGLLSFTDPLQLYGNQAPANGELGFFIGDGTQSNYIQFVLTPTGIEAFQEINDNPQTPIIANIPTGSRPSSSVDFFFKINPATGVVTLQYKLDGGTTQTLGTINASGSILTAIQQSNTPLAVGLIGTSNTPGVEVEGTWDYLNVAGSQPTVAQQLPNLEKFIGDANDTFDLNDYFDDDQGDAGLTYAVESNTNPAIGANINGDILTLTYPTADAAIATITISATDGDNLSVSQSFTVNVIDEPVVLFRVNAGDVLVAATDDNIDWAANTGGGAQSGNGFSVNTGNISTHNVSGRDASVPAYAPQALFAKERWDPPAAPEMMWTFETGNGNFIVNLFMSNGFSGTSEPGERVFDVEMEGILVIDGKDLSAEYGSQVGAMESYNVTVADGVLNIEFLHDVENPTVNAIEILGAGGSVTTPIAVTNPGDQANEVGDAPSLQIVASGGEGTLTYEATGLPAGLSISNTGLISGTITATANVYPVSITVDDASDNTAAQTVDFNWTVVNPAQAMTAYRVNAGGAEVASNDDLPLAWSEDQSATTANGSANIGTPSPYLNTDAADLAFGAAFTGTNNTGYPNALFSTERYSEEDNPNNMQWDFPVENGNYTVNLIFAEVWTGAQNTGVRVFDVEIEGQLVLDDFDQTAAYGWNTAGVETFTVNVTDGNLDIDFFKGVQNPSIKAIEILGSDVPAPITVNPIADQTNVEGDDPDDIEVVATGGDPLEDFQYSAVGLPPGVDIEPTTGVIFGETIEAGAATNSPYIVTVTVDKPSSDPVEVIFNWTVSASATLSAALVEIIPGGGNINASTFSNSSFEITNLSPSASITSVTFDMSTGFLPNMVFDPNGTAGDKTAKGFSINQDVGGTVNSSFSLPLGNGGFQGLEIDFTDFAPGEKFEFSIDQDPTSTEGLNAPGPGESGSVSGLEQVGSTVTVTFSDGSSYTTNLYGDGSNAGATAIAKANIPAAPVIQAVGLNSPATTNTPNQVIQITGGPANGTVSLLQVEGAFFEGGADLQQEPFEVNSVISVNRTTGIQLDGNGAATVAVTLTDANAEGGYNYFIAAIEDGNEFGLTSNAVVLEYDDQLVTTSDILYRVNVGGPEVAAADGTEPAWGQDQGGFGNANNSPYLVALSTGTTLYNGGNGSAHPGPIVVTDPSILPSMPDVVFNTERYDPQSNPEMKWEFPIEAGKEIEIRLLFAELFNGIDAAGERVFDVEVEGVVPPVFDNIDPFAIAGAKGAFVLSFQTTVEDGILDLEFIHDVENPALKGIEIAAVGVAIPNSAPVVTNPGTQNGVEGDIVSLPIIATDVDPCTGLTYSAEGLPPSLAIDPITGVISGTLDVAVEGNDGDEGAFIEEGGLVVIEMESADNLPGSWVLGPDENPTSPNINNPGGATGGQFIVWEGGQFFGNQNNGQITYQVQINNPGTYQFKWRNQVGNGTNTTEHNDTWLKIEADAFYGQKGSSIVCPKGFDGNANDCTGGAPEGAGGNGFFKVYSSGANNWSWSTNTSDNDAHQIFARFDEPGTYDITIAARSSSHVIDRMVLVSTAYNGTGQDLSLPESQRVTGGIAGTPGAAENSPYDVTVTVADGCTPALSTVVDFTWNVTTEPVDGLASALVEITPGGGLGASTFGGSSIQVTNTSQGNLQITDVSIDLSTGILPDMVFDPVGAGGDGTASCFTPNSGAAATGLVAPANPCVDPFSAPRNGGFDILSIGFTEFDPAEQFFFTVDIDPNSIQGVPGAGNSGAVSGLELAGATITITFNDGTVLTSSLYEDGSLGGGQAVVADLAPVAPSIGAVGVPGTVACVADLDQIIEVSGTPGDHVSLMVVDTRTFIASGNPPFNVTPEELPFYANEIVAKALYTGIIGQDGTVQIPVTLFQTDLSNDPDGGINYIVAVSSEGPYAVDQQVSQTSNTLILRVDPTCATANPAAFVQVNSGGGLFVSTFGNNSFQITNTGDIDIAKVTINSSTAFMFDVVFDPVGKAGDAGAKCLTQGNAGNTGAEVGITVPANGGSDAADCESVFALPHNGIDDEEGYDEMTLDFTDFNPGESFAFGVDMDPTSIKGDLTTGDAGSISGFELIGSAITIEFANGEVITSSLFDEGSLGGSQAVVALEAPAAPSITINGTANNQVVNDLNQTVVVTGASGASVTLLQIDTRLYIDPGNPNVGFDVDPFEANEAVAKVLYTATIGVDGTVSIPVTLLQTPGTGGAPDAGLNHFIAVVDGIGEQTSPTSNTIVVEYSDEVQVDADLTITYTIQGRTDQTADLSVKLYEVGSTTPIYEFTTTGSAEGEVTVTDMIPGTYEVAVKGINTLQVVETATLVAGSNALDMGQLLTGDVNGDNAVNAVDFSALVGSFNSGIGDPGFNPNADFNGDGEITAVDFSLIVSNFNVAGEEPSGASQLRTGNIQSRQIPWPYSPIDNVVMRLQGDFRSVMPGEEFVMTWVVDAGKQKMDAVEAHLTYDTRLLEVVGMSWGETFEVTLRDDIDHQAGKLHLAAGSFERTPNQQVEVAYIRFRAKAAGIANIDFQDQGKLVQAVTYGGSNVLHTTQAASVAVGAALPGEMQLNIYPVPSEGDITIELANANASELRIVNTSGQVIYKRKHTGSVRETLDLGQYAKGVYQAMVVSGETVLIRRFILK